MSDFPVIDVTGGDKELDPFEKEQLSNLGKAPISPEQWVYLSELNQDTSKSATVQHVSSAVSNTYTSVIIEYIILKIC